MTPTSQPDIRTALSDRQALICTLYGEGRGEARLSQVAIACCIRNRVQMDLHHDGKPDWWGERVPIRAEAAIVEEYQK